LTPNQQHEEQINQILAAQLSSDQRIALLEARCGVSLEAVDPRTADGSTTGGTYDTNTDSCSYSNAVECSRNTDSSSSSLRSSDFSSPITQLPPPAIDHVLRAKGYAYAFDEIKPDANALDVATDRTPEIATSQWIVPHLLNGWVGLEGFGSASYSKDALGWVHLDGA